MLTAENTKLPGVKLIRPDILTDVRGDYVMIYQQTEYARLGITCEFVEHCISTSRKGVLRGIHADYECQKLIQILHGSVYYVLVDTATKEWEAFILSDRNHWQLFKPARYAAGLLALEDDTVFCYYQNRFYDPKRQVTYKWDDPKLGIWWPHMPGGYIMARGDEDISLRSGLLAKS